MMAAAAPPADTDRLDLPPAFTLVRAPAPMGAFELACRLADRDGAGTLVWPLCEDRLDVAVVLEPDEPLRTARRAFVAGMAALVDALGSAAPPEKPITLEWPDTVRFDGARLGGGRLGWPKTCAEDEAPAWMVFGATLIASKSRAGDPGLTPDSTSLDEEGFERDGHAAFVEAFARYLMRGFDSWRGDGFEAMSAAYLARLSGRRAGERLALDEVGDLLTMTGSCVIRTALLPGLQASSWLDPATGGPRL